MLVPTPPPPPLLHRPHGTLDRLHPRWRHSLAPSLAPPHLQGKSQEILVTGIKVVDLLAPYAKGGKIGLFGGAGVGKTGAFSGRGVGAVELGVRYTKQGGNLTERGW